jgi:phage shock protein A
VSSASSIAQLYSTCRSVSSGAAGDRHQPIHESDRQHGRAERHAELRDPQRGRVRRLAHIADLDRDLDHLEAEIRQIGGKKRSDRQTPELRQTTPRAVQVLQSDGDADVTAALEGVGERQERRRRHAIAGVGREARNRDPEQPADDAGQNDHGDRDHEQRAQRPAGHVEAGENGTHDRPSSRWR